MSERENIKDAADRLAAYAVTCRMTNTLAWMTGLKNAINNYLAAVDDNDRVITFGYGLQTISEEEMADRILEGGDE
jgi:hypothetical protein